MRLLIDNTGLHAASRALHRKAAGSHDLDSLLQLMIQLIFSDEINISMFESESVMELTNEALMSLNKNGFPQQSINRIEYNINEIRSICDLAADSIGMELQSSKFDFTNDDRKLAGFSVPGLPQETIRKDVTLVKSMIIGNQSVSDLESIGEASLNYKIAGQIPYTLQASPQIIETLRGYPEDYWDLHTMINLFSFVRCHTNMEIAKSEKSIYTPAIARASRMRRISETLTKNLEQIVISGARTMTSLPLKLTSISDTLVKMSKGSLKGLLDCSLELRLKATELRKIISRNIEKVDVSSPLGFRHLNEELGELARILDFELNRSGRPSCKKVVFDLTSAIDGSIPDISNAYNLINYRWKRGRVAALTELSTTMAYSDDAKPEYTRLLLDCGVKL